MKTFRLSILLALTGALAVCAPALVAPARADAPVAPAAAKKLTGTAIGTPGSYQDGGNTIAKAFDGDINTFFDAPESTNGNGTWVGLDLGSAKTITKIRFVPRSDFPGRMVGGKFQSSTTKDFVKPVDLFVIKDEPAVGSFAELKTLLSKDAFQFVRYLSPDDGWGNVAEIEFY